MDNNGSEDNLVERDSDPLSSQKQPLVHKYITEAPEGGGKPEVKSGTDLCPLVSIQYEVKDDHSESACDTDLILDAEEDGMHCKLNARAKHWIAGEADPLSSQKQPLVHKYKSEISDAEDGKHQELNARADHGLAGEEGCIVGSLARDGARLLRLDLSVRSTCFHVFTIQEIKHVLERQEPTKLCLPGIEALHKSSEVYELIFERTSTCKDWNCGKMKTIRSLVAIDKELDILKDSLLPDVIRRKGMSSPSKGNRRKISNVIKKANKISKLAKSLKRNKKITGEVIASELCSLINSDPPRYQYLKDHIIELIDRVRSEQDKPVWFDRSSKGWHSAMDVCKQ